MVGCEMSTCRHRHIQNNHRLSSITRYTVQAARATQGQLFEDRPLYSEVWKGRAYEHVTIPTACSFRDMCMGNHSIRGRGSQCCPLRIRCLSSVGAAEPRHGPSFWRRTRSTFDSQHIYDQQKKGTHADPMVYTRKEKVMIDETGDVLVTRFRLRQKPSHERLQNQFSSVIHR